MLFPDKKYFGDPPFFSDDGEGVSLKYIAALRDVLGIRLGKSLMDEARIIAEKAWMYDQLAK